MKRFDIAPRSGWKETVERQGLIWHTADGKPYWSEDGYYSFTLAQIEAIEEATTNCYQLFLEAGEYVIQNGLLNSFNVPYKFHDAIRSTWFSDLPALNYGRFDFGYDGINPPKLFEFNADTPTSLLEASVIQWQWKEEKFPHNDQFNGIHEALVARWAAIRPYLNERHVHFAHIDDELGEDTLNVSYMRDIAEEAGLTTSGILMQDIGFNHHDCEFIDLAGHEMEVVYKLYPWEWLMNEGIGDFILQAGDETQWLEPMWKSIWSNKAILPILSEIAPSHPNLLEAYFDTGIAPAKHLSYVKKPILAREGANIQIVKEGKLLAESEGKYTSGDCVYQELYAIPDFGGGKFPVIGSWCVDGEPVGMGIREDGLITGNNAKFIPHIIEG